MTNAQLLKLLLSLAKALLVAVVEWLQAHASDIDFGRYTGLVEALLSALAKLLGLASVIGLSVPEEPSSKLVEAKQQTEILQRILSGMQS